ncbi:MAG: Holliday junction resolvase RuvX [Phycisphaera sp.]|nr:Holliday junction resolvase RuvX [Phycisphaera sp.]
MLSGMKHLAIDLGGKRTGLAVGSDVTRIASPIGVVNAADDGQRLDAIAEAVDEHGPNSLVMGLPINMDGTEGDGARRARAFGELLQARFALPVVFVDERLSSDEADAMMSRSGLTHKGKKQRRDALAAVAILRRYWEGLE